MTFIPNEASATYPAQSGPDSVDFDILLNAVRRIGVSYGLAVGAQSTPDMTLAVAVGSTEQNGTRYAVSAGNVTIGTADATNPRFDLVVVDASGATQVRAGSANSNPVFPALTAGDVVLAAVYVPATVTAITNAMLVDKRVVLPSTYNLGLFGDGSDGTVNFDGTSTVLGLVPSSGKYSMNRDLYLDDGSQVSGTAILHTAGYRIYCRGTFTVGSTATVGNMSLNASGATAGSATSAQSLGTGSNGGAGGAGVTGAAGTTLSAAPLGGVGGAGGIASGGGTGGGPAGGGATAVALAGKPRSLTFAMQAVGFTSTTAFVKYQGGAGGGGGTAATSSTGGGGGGGAGGVWLAVRDLVNNGTISANGGNGGNASGTGTGGGGGGGGGGGYVIVLCGSNQGSGSITANGGTGGSPQGAGATGATGSAGAVYVLTA